MNKEGLNVNNATVIDFYEEIKNNPKYLMADKIHLTKEGNKALKEKIVTTLNQKEIESE